MILHKKDYSLLPHNTFGIDVKCIDFYEYDQKEDLKTFYNEGVFESEWMPIGQGSNILLMNNLKCAVLHSKIGGVKSVDSSDEKIRLKVGSGVIWDDFVQWTVDHCLGGVENLSFIPGTVGASPVQNIGAYGVEAKDVIDQVEVYDTKKNVFFTLDNADCSFEYRNSLFKQEKHLIVVSVVFKMENMEKHRFSLDYGNVKERVGTDISLRNVRNAIINIRKEKLPLPEEIGSAGSFFKNPVVDEESFNRIRTKYSNMPFYKVETGYKIPAAWLISKCGWKGKRLGNAGCYEKQPLILINCGGATGGEIATLMKKIQNDVNDEFNIDLFPEVCIVV